MSLRFGDQVHSTGGLIFADQTTFESTSDVFGSGVLQAQSATIAATVIRGIQDLGTPPEVNSGSATVSGSGPAIRTGDGALAAQAAAVSGSGNTYSSQQGTGVLVAQSAAVAGAGFKGIGGSGALLAQAATVTGIGGLAGQIFGTGVLVAQQVTISGSGEREIKGAGTLNQQAAVMSGLGTVIQIAVDYVCYLQPNPIMLEALSVNTSYSLQFRNPRNIPRSVKVNWDDLVDYHAGPAPQTEVAYRFSNDKEFVEDQNDYPHGDDD